MLRRVFVLLTLLSAALFSPSLPGARAQVAGNPNDLPTPLAERFPRAPHEEAGMSLLRRRGAERRSQSLSKEEKRLLAVPRADYELHADFLRRPRTGLVRLLPRETYERKLALRGGGAYYSFIYKEHEYGYGSDIELQNDKFTSSFAGADIGFIVDLGEAPLETVSAGSDAVRFMADFEPPSAEPEARKLFRRFASGERVEQWTYKRTLPAVVGHTYALRSVNYDDSDVLVAFRVLRKDADGSVVLLWKLLKRYPPTFLSRSAR